MDSMKRYLEDQVRHDLKKKMVFLGGPRQVGKTTLAQSLGPRESYLNWDDVEDREKILKRILPPEQLWIFDEIHKYRQWRGYLKGLYDKNKGEKKILVTGSARLDLLRYSGDSLQGRYHFLRLYPLTTDELKIKSQGDLKNLLHLGGFPEPFLGGHEVEARRWSREYRQRILRDDISSIERISDLGQAELLLLRLPELVGSPLSINSLREDLQVSHKTLSRWLNIFERFYAIFRISPFGSPKVKAVKKEQKHYHYDWTLVKDAGAKFENFIGMHLLKRCHFMEDTQGRELDLRFYKDHEGREVDFILCENQKPLAMIEVKLAEKNISPHLKYLKNKFPKVAAFQILLDASSDYSSGEGIRVGPAKLLLDEVLSMI